MIEERRSERRKDIDRRTSSGRRITEDEWLPPYESKRYGTRDRRCHERRGLDRREPV